MTVPETSEIPLETRHEWSFLTSYSPKDSSTQSVHDIPLTKAEHQPSHSMLAVVFAVSQEAQRDRIILFETKGPHHEQLYWNALEQAKFRHKKHGLTYPKNGDRLAPERTTDVQMKLPYNV